mmetsp:Transcript_9539/g.21312  ORF Transcript_9539/g.21312 Transcript_9539/m.21312 type:complete len:181 (+) Transcript_9539:1317-1859(+)
MVGQALTANPTPTCSCPSTPMCSPKFHCDADIGAQDMVTCSHRMPETPQGGLRQTESLCKALVPEERGHSESLARVGHATMVESEAASRWVVEENLRKEMACKHLHPSQNSHLAGTSQLPQIACSWCGSSEAGKACDRFKMAAQGALVVCKRSCSFSAEAVARLARARGCTSEGLGSHGF